MSLIKGEMMKKEYKKPTIGLFPTKCNVSSLSPDEPEEIDGSRRSLMARVGLIATVGHVTLLHASCIDVNPKDGVCDNDDGGP